MSNPTTQTAPSAEGQASRATERVNELSTTEDSSLPDPSVEQYEKAVLGAAIKAANLLDELMGLSIIPDPRVKDAADVALGLVALMNEQNRGIQNKVASKGD